MCCTAHGIDISRKFGGKQAPIRLIALAFCIAYIVVSLLGAGSLLTHVNHEHDHDGPNGSCAACAHMTAAENLLKQLSTAVAGVVLVIGSLFAPTLLLKSISVRRCFYTPVKLKVRLNN